MPDRDVAPAGDLPERLDAYAAATALVSRLLLESPDGPLLAQLSAPGVLGEWPLRSDDHAAGIASLSVSLLQERESMHQVHADHRRLFLGPERVLACPYESVYLGKEHLTFGSQTLEVRRWYHSYGLHAPAEGREPDDHIGLELYFVSHLCLRALDAIERGADESYDACRALGEFLNQHLLLWADQCVDKVLAHAESEFFRGVGRLTRGVVRGLEIEFAR